MVFDHLTLTPDANTHDNDKGLLMSSMESPEVKEPLYDPYMTMTRITERAALRCQGISVCEELALYAWTK